MSRLLNMFNLFGLGYFIYLLIAIGMIVALVLCLRKLSDKARKITEIVLVSSMGLFVILEYIGRIIGTKNFKFGDNLPLEFFEISVYFCIFILFTQKNSWQKFAYLILVPVAAYSLIFVPNMYTIYSTFSLSIISFYIVNALIISYGVLKILWLDDYMEKRNILDASLTYVIIVSIAHLVNVLFRFTAWGIHANYFGTMGEEYDVLIKWLYSIIPVPLVCLLPLIAILVGVQFLLVLPFDLLKTKKNKQSEIEELIALGNMKAQAEHRANSRNSKSQILVRSDKKAEPSTPKNIKNTSTGKGFVTPTKEVKVNKDNKSDS